KDQVLFGLDKSDLQASYDQAAAALKIVEANYQMSKEQIENAKLQLTRYKELYEVGAISKADLEKMELSASDASLQVLEAQMDQARAAYQSAEDMLADMDVKSPIAGIVTAINVDVGDMATSASPTVTIVEMDSVYISVSVSEKVINHIKNGQEVLVEIAAASKTNVKGQIASLSPAADGMTGQYALKVYIDNKNHEIKPGMFARVEIATASKDGVIAVPTDSIIFRGDKYVAYVIEDGKAVEREVSTGLDNGKTTEMLKGLSVGEILIVSGQNYVTDGTEIKIVTLDGEPVVEKSSAVKNSETGTDGTEKPSSESTQAGGGTK
ncbi:MAG: efflux RND transporter periplasmic adaptor subunit, partial [Eubacteriales bacterium]